MPIKIYHNPRCSKSRQTLDILNSKGCNPEIIHYLDTPPSVDELKNVLKKLALNVRDIMRSGEARYKELGLDNPGLSDDELLSTMIENPKLIQRPIVINGTKACIGRPPESVLDII